MSKLKGDLDTDVYDAVRIALGLEKMSDAVRKGQEISDNIRNKIENN